MEQFKIDVSECTGDEKRRILSKLQETYQICKDSQLAIEPPLFGNWIVVDSNYLWDGGVCIHAGGRNSLAPERPASDFLNRFQTRPHDYTGCHPDIAAALKRGEEILCRDESDDEGWVYTWNSKTKIYDCETTAFLNVDAEPIPAEPAKKSVTLELTDAQLAQIKEMIDE